MDKFKHFPPPEIHPWILGRFCPCGGIHPSAPRAVFWEAAALCRARSRGGGVEQSQHVSAPGEGEREESEALEIANKVNDNPGAGGTQRMAAGERRLWGSGTGTRVLGEGWMGWDQQQDPNGCLSFPPHGASRRGFWGFMVQGGSQRGPLAPVSLLEDLRGAGGCGHPSASRGRVLGVVWAWCNLSGLAHVDRAACWLFRKHQIGEN